MQFVAEVVLFAVEALLVAEALVVVSSRIRAMMMKKIKRSVSDKN